MNDSSMGPYPPPPGRDSRASLAEDERAMRGGRGGVVALAALGAMVVLGLGAMFAFREDTSAYGAVGRQINGMRSEHFDAFWMCALPRANVRSIDDNRALADAIHERANFNPTQYAQLVRGTCLARLRDHVLPLDQLLPPDDVQPGVESLRSSLRNLIEAWNAYLAVLVTVDDYDPASDESIRQVSAITRAWFEYTRAHATLNDVIRAHLDGA